MTLSGDSRLPESPPSRDVEPLILTDPHGADLSLEADYSDNRQTKPIVVVGCGSGMDWGGMWLTPEQAREVAAWLTTWADSVDGGDGA